MRSPPSSELFISSPLQSMVKELDEEVRSLYRTALDVESLDSHLSATIKSNKDTFLDVFGRQVQLLASRSQLLEHAQVTIYDKVLLLLTESGDNLENPAAITWYCTKYLGYQGDAADQSNNSSVEQFLAVNAAASRVFAPPVNGRPSPAPHHGPPLFSTEMDVDSASKCDPRFLNFWTVYSKAHTDYLAVADKHDTATLDAAKFLRDTAENGIHFLENKRPNKALLIELKNTYNMAKEVVVQLNGGRKRKFDRAPDRASPRGREIPPTHTTAHDRLNTVRRREHKKTCGKGEQRGRGPSGIPYGYTRPVDSYYPK